MMRKISLLLAGALMGASAMSLVYGAPGSTANAAARILLRDGAASVDVLAFARVVGET